MDNETLKSIWKKAHAFALRRGLGDQAEDFAQEAVLICSQKNLEHPKFDWLLTNYEDKCFGNHDTKPGRNRRFETKLKCSLDQPISDDSETRMIDLFDGALAHEDPTDQLLEEIQTHEIEGNFSGKEAYLFRERFINGRDVKDIAKDLEVSASRISGMLNPIKKTLERLASIEGVDGYVQVMHRYNSDGTFGVFVIDWIKV